MSKDYEGKIGIGQLILCLFAAATLLIPIVIEPSLVFAFEKIMPIGTTSEIAAMQTKFIQSIFEAANIYDKLPAEIFSILPYSIYAFYGIVAFDLVFTLFIMISRSEILRQILRAFSIFLGFVLLIIVLANVPAIAGFFTCYFNNGFGDKLIFECIKNEGFLFFLGFFVLAVIVMINQFSSFFGKTY